MAYNVKHYWLIFLKKILNYLKTFFKLSFAQDYHKLFLQIQENLC